MAETISFIDNRQGRFIRAEYENPGLVLYIPSSDYVREQNEDGTYTYTGTIPDVHALQGIYLRNTTLVDTIDRNEVVSSLVEYLKLYQVPEGEQDVFVRNINKVIFVYDKYFNLYYSIGDTLILELLKTMYPSDQVIGSYFKCYFDSFTVPKYCIYKLYFELFANNFTISGNTTLKQYLEQNLTGNERLLYDNATVLISSSNFVTGVKTSLGMSDEMFYTIFREGVKFMLDVYDNY